MKPPIILPLFSNPAVGIGTEYLSNIIYIQELRPILVSLLIAALVRAGRNRRRNGLRRISVPNIKKERP